MVNRKYFQCMTCDCGFTCRTQFGSGREQTYLFPCTSCGVELGFTLYIDRENLGWSYGDLINLIDYQGSGEPQNILNFASDYLVRRNHKNDGNLSTFTPQFENIELVKDVGAYFTTCNIRRTIAQDMWPVLNRADIHRKRSDRHKFDKELKSIKADKWCDSYETGTMREIIAQCFEKFEANFNFELESTRHQISTQITSAQLRDATAIVELKRLYKTQGRADHLYQELRSIDRQWVELYSFFEPLEILECLKKPSEKLSEEFTLSEKPINRLKTFYSDCFETAGRILTLAGTYESISLGRGIGIPSRRRLIPIDEFERIPNGTKPDLVSEMSFWPIFKDIFDSKLRNGIGHHSWRYEAATDTIHYQNNSQARGREEFSMAYMDFCIHVRKMFHAVTACSRYVHSVWETND